MGVILSATAALNWYANIVGATAHDLTAELGTELRAPSGAYFLPYLAGERTPHNDAKVRGSFHGLGGEMNRVDLTQAVLEGVAFALRDNLEALRKAGTEPTEVTAVGGGLNSFYWLEAIATALNIPVHIPEDAEIGAAFGAARLAMLADHVAGPLELCRPAKSRAIIEPNQRLGGAFEEAYARYCAAYKQQRKD